MYNICKLQKDKPINLYTIIIMSFNKKSDLNVRNNFILFYYYYFHTLLKQK